MADSQASSPATSKSPKKRSRNKGKKGAVQDKSHSRAGSLSVEGSSLENGVQDDESQPAPHGDLDAPAASQEIASKAGDGPSSKHVSKGTEAQAGSEPQTVEQGAGSLGPATNGSAPHSEPDPAASANEAAKADASHDGAEPEPASGDSSPPLSATDRPGVQSRHEDKSEQAGQVSAESGTSTGKPADAPSGNTSTADAGSAQPPQSEQGDEDTPTPPAEAKGQGSRRGSNGEAWIQKAGDKRKSVDNTAAKDKPAGGGKGRVAEPKPEPTQQTDTKDPVQPQSSDKSAQAQDQSAEAKPQSADGKSQSAEGKDQSAEGQDQSAEGKDQSAAGKGQSAEGKDQSAAGKGQSAEGQDQSAEGKSQSAEGKSQSAARKDQSAAGKDQSAAGKDQSAEGKSQSAENKDQSAEGKDKSAEGKDQPAKPKDQPARPEDQSAKPKDPPADTKTQPDEKPQPAATEGESATGPSDHGGDAEDPPRGGNGQGQGRGDGAGGSPAGEQAAGRGGGGASPAPTQAQNGVGRPTQSQTSGGGSGGSTGAPPAGRPVWFRYVRERVPKQLARVLYACILAVVVRVFYGETSGPKVVKRDVALFPGDKLGSDQYIQHCSSPFHFWCEPRHFAVSAEGEVGLYRGLDPNDNKGVLWEAGTKAKGKKAVEQGRDTSVEFTKDNQLVVTRGKKVIYKSDVAKLPKDLQPWPLEVSKEDKA